MIKIPENCHHNMPCLMERRGICFRTYKNYSLVPQKLTKPKKTTNIYVLISSVRPLQKHLQKRTCPHKEQRCSARSATSLVYHPHTIKCVFFFEPRELLVVVVVVAERKIIVRSGLVAADIRPIKSTRVRPSLPFPTPAASPITPPSPEDKNMGRQQKPKNRHFTKKHPKRSRSTSAT